MVRAAKEIAIAVFMATPAERRQIFVHLSPTERRLVFTEMQSGTDYGCLLKQQLLNNMVFECQSTSTTESTVPWSALIHRSQVREANRIAYSQNGDFMAHDQLEMAVH